MSAPLLDFAQAAARLAVSPRQLRKIVKSGRLAFVNTGFGEHAISPLVQTSDLHSAKAKQINAIQTPTPNAERHSARATKESN